MKDQRRRELDNVRRRSAELAAQYADAPAPKLPPPPARAPWDAADKRVAARETQAARDRATRSLVPDWDAEV